jgi:hypothetical protein
VNDDSVRSSGVQCSLCNVMVTCCDVIEGCVSSICRMIKGRVHGESNTLILMLEQFFNFNIYEQKH